MTPKILTVFAVALLSACGTGAHSAGATSFAVGSQATTDDLHARSVTAPATGTTSASTERDTEGDYVVGPIVAPTEGGEPGVATYYIVRN